MSSHIPRLRRLFTPEYAKRINAQLVHPASSVLVKPNELASSLARPVHLAHYEPEKMKTKKGPWYLAATLSYGVIKGHPFVDGNKRTAFFLANEYIRAMGLPGLGADASAGNVGEAYGRAVAMAELHMGVAAGTIELEGLAEGMTGK